MYQVLHDTNNVTDSGCHCVSADHSSRDQGCWRGTGSVAVLLQLQVQNCSLLLGIILDKAATSKSGNGVGRR